MSIVVKAWWEISLRIQVGSELRKQLLVGLLAISCLGLEGVAQARMTSCIVRSGVYGQSCILQGGCAATHFGALQVGPVTSSHV